MQGLMQSYPLTLTHVFRRAERLFPEKEIATVEGDGIVRIAYGEWAERTRRLAGVLDALEISADARVGTFAWNTARHLELYFAAPCSGRVLHTLNIRLFPDDVVYNAPAVTIPAAPAFGVTATDRQRLSKGVRVQVRGVRIGRARVTLAFKVRDKTVKVGEVVKLAPYTARAVTIRATGAKLRSLRRALANGPLAAEITVRTFSGKSPVTVRTTVLR